MEVTYSVHQLKADGNLQISIIGSIACALKANHFPAIMVGRSLVYQTHAENEWEAK